MTEESNALAPPLSVASIKAVIAQFLTDRLQPKLEKVAEEDSEQRALLLAAYAPKSWIPDAARRGVQIQQVTHAIKYTHPDARGSSLYSAGNPQAAEAEVGTHTLGEQLAADVVGNAAALDVYKFLNLRVGERSILDLAVANEPALAAAFSEDAVEARHWMQSFAALTESKGQLASHKLAKQIYWPLGDGTYHLLSPLFPTSLAHAAWSKIREDNELAWSVRKARTAGEILPTPFSDYPNLLIQKFGGDNPQNISQLNANRGSKNNLLPALPPNWESPVIRPPFAVNSIFDRIFSSRPRVRELTRILRDFLVSVEQVNNVRIRDKRAELSRLIYDEALLYGAELRDAVETGQLPAGWSLDDACKLNRAEQLWLDPLRCQIDPDFARDTQRDEWPDEICRRFGNWLNARLTTERTPMSAIEAEHWRSELEKEMRLLRRELADHE
jgi:CRISPR-associated protein Csy1